MFGILPFMTSFSDTLAGIEHNMILLNKYEVRNRSVFHFHKKYIGIFEDIWCEVDSLTELFTRICQFLGSFGHRLMLHMKWGSIYLMFLCLLTWYLFTWSAPFLNTSLIIYGNPYHALVWGICHPFIHMYYIAYCAVMSL